MIFWATRSITILLRTTNRTNVLLLTAKPNTGATNAVVGATTKLQNTINGKRIVKNVATSETTATMAMATTAALLLKPLQLLPLRLLLVAPFLSSQP